MFGWHHSLNRSESEPTSGDSGGQGSLACCSPWGCKESDTTERLNNKQSLSKDCGYKLEDGSEAAYSGRMGWGVQGPKVTPA